jgi:hypothetical protein
MSPLSPVVVFLMSLVPSVALAMPPGVAALPPPRAGAAPAPSTLQVKAHPSAPTAPKVGPFRPVVRVPAPAPTHVEMAAALAFVDDLAPRVDPRSDASRALPPAAKAILGAFGRARTYVRRVASDAGVGPLVVDHAPESSADQIEGDLAGALSALPPPPGGAAYRVADASTILRAAADSPGVDAPTKAALLRSAETWDAATRGDAAWSTARRMKPRTSATVAQGRQEPLPASFEQKLRDQADQEWRRGVRATGWGPDRKEFDLNADVLNDTPADVRAFTYEGWMTYRVEKLRRIDEERALRQTLHRPTF